MTETKHKALSVRKHEFSVDEVKRQAGMVRELMQGAMKNGVHYGVIPGCNKPSLLKPGTEKINLMFRLATEIVQTIEVDLPNLHKHIRVKVRLRHIHTSQVWGEGEGSCSTMESRYRYRKGVRKCPQCQAEAIIKGKAEYGGGWLCWAKKGGCGAKFGDGDRSIEGQSVDQTENENPADQWNTVLKMATKRGKVDAALSIGACSDLFTQDMEDVRTNEKVARGEPVQAHAEVVETQASGAALHTLCSAFGRIARAEDIARDKMPDLLADYAAEVVGKPFMQELGDLTVDEIGKVQAVIDNMPGMLVAFLKRKGAKSG